ncbi:hypothetical protein SDRG_13035 [Saprolegnia diclina VS20]|uniref:subtilisin n=1 Tax=Saprolegnia diclina (strain VS20) TaxID=1156394 RepID=T0RH74_SAPDV|nr:hypothetical protein SDRG_13035 [Saprolegnia diclina VS20]EQC29162.1 hypothetical protein SDRG_13035 [Saprolegnia diclina VS20]|eukprot:XP_008617340.1 hypothetical protein SDRG_13035 [Saprolegnia diclina VS20]
MLCPTRCYIAGVLSYVLLLSTLATAKVAPRVHRHLAVYDTMDIFVTFTSHQAALDRVASTPAHRDHRTRVFEALRDHAIASQKAALALLHDHTSKSFWISCSAVVHNASASIVAALALLADVVTIEPISVVELDPVLAGVDDNTTSTDVEWGVATIGAPAMWPITNGSGIVVGSIDTGVRHSHEALKSNWRRHRGWYDPYNRTRLPSDDTGHGTHTTGTMVGRHGIGVAPGAQWIACKGLLNGRGTSAALLECAQFMLCPTYSDGNHPDCSQGADVVNNSWGGATFHPWFEGAVAAWHKAGITPVFSIGNKGPACASAGNPGGYPNVLSVGAVGSHTNDPSQLAYFSAKGPATYKDRRGVVSKLIKPVVAAPGFFIRSAKFTGNHRYGQLAGTSMAAPHVSGIVALLKSHDPALTYDDIYKLVTETTERASLQPEPTTWAMPCNVTAPGAFNCGGTPDTTWPNNRYGYGRVSVTNMMRHLDAATLVSAPFPVVALARVALPDATPVPIALVTYTKQVLAAWDDCLITDTVHNTTHERFYYDAHRQVLQSEHLHGHCLDVIHDVVVQWKPCNDAARSQKWRLEDDHIASVLLPGSCVDIQTPGPRVTLAPCEPFALTQWFRSTVTTELQSPRATIFVRLTTKDRRVLARDGHDVASRRALDTIYEVFEYDAHTQLLQTGDTTAPLCWTAHGTSLQLLPCDASATSQEWTIDGTHRRLRQGEWCVEVAPNRVEVQLARCQYAHVGQWIDAIYVSV